MAGQRLTFGLERTSEGGRGVILPDGVYKFRVDEVEVKQGQAGPYASLKLKALGDRKGTVYTILSGSEKSRWVVEAFLDAAGFPKKGAAVSPDRFRGKEVWAEVGNTSYEKEDKATKKKTIQLKNEIKAWLTEADAKQLLDVYAQNAKPASSGRPTPQGKDPFADSYTNQGDGEGEESKQEWEEEEEDDDEAVFGTPPGEDSDDEFGPA